MKEGIEAAPPAVSGDPSPRASPTAAGGTPVQKQAL